MGQPCVVPLYLLISSIEHRKLMTFYQMEFDMPFSSTVDPIIIRMTQEDRQSINLMIQHKRDEFENVIKKGIVSMLNAHIERKKISKERKAYLNVLTRRGQQKKEQLSMIAETAKHATASAPLGISVASHLAIATANGVGSAAIENAETRRQETEAQEQFHSAQMLHYVTDQDYEDIAQSVASTLSYRFQFLLFRLAAGENGYMKLAEFFVDSINKHAIERLREHKNEVVKALIDAAIPPSTDAISYRDWPQVNFSKFKLQHRFALHKALELDEDANQIIARCGPAVRALLGAYRSRVDSVSGKIRYYNPYTILGALNHAPILNSEAGVFKGLETPDRKFEILDGTMKYPMILLAVGETTADLGVNFATKATGRFLESAHVVALLRLVPGFFSHQVIHQRSTHEPPEIALPTINNADLRYPLEQFECPWTQKREYVWQQRLEYLYTIDASGVPEEEVVLTQENSRLKAMEAASNIFDVQEAKKNLQLVIDKALLTEIEVNAVDIKTQERSKMQLEAAIASKYAALATSELMTCSIQCNALDESNFNLAVDGIEAANSAFNAARGIPVEETSRYHRVVDASSKATEYVNFIFQQHAFYRENFQMVLTLVQNTKEFIAGEKWHNRNTVNQIGKIKAFKALIKEDAQESSTLMSLSRTMTEYLQQESPPLGQTTALEAFYRASDGLRDVLDAQDIPADPATTLKIIQCHLLETQRNREHIHLAFAVDMCDLVDSSTTPVDTAHEDIKVSALAAADTAHNQALTALQNTNQLIANLSVWQRNISLGTASEALLRSYVAQAVDAKNASLALLRRIKYAHQNPSSDIAVDVNLFLARAQANAERGLLRFIVKQHEAARLIKTEKSMPNTASDLRLEEALTQFELAVRRLNHAIKLDRVSQATTAHDRVTQAVNIASSIPSFQALEKNTRHVQQARMAIEQALTHDIEITDFSRNKAQWAVTEGERAVQEMKEMKEELCNLQKYCILEELSIDTLSVSDSKSDSTSTPTNVKQLADLDALFNLMNTSDVRGPQDLADSELCINYLLYQLIDTCTSISTGVILREAEIKSKILTSIQFLKHEIALGAKGLSAHWESWLLAHVVEWVMNTTQEMEKNVLSQLDAAKKELNLIKQIANDEFSALKTARESALKAIKKAYMDIGHAREKQREVEKNPHVLGRVTWALVQSTLAWSARLTDSEYKWLEGKREAKYVQRLSVDYMSSRMRAYLFSLVYSRCMLDNQKEQIRRLNRVFFLLKQCQKQLYDLGQSAEKVNLKALPFLEKKHDWLDSLVGNKLEQAEIDENNIALFKSSIEAQAIRIFFGEWKKKTHNENKQDVRTLALKAAMKEKQQSVARHVDLVRPGNEKAKILENEMEANSKADFSHEKRKMKHMLPTSVRKCKDDAANNTIDDIELMVEKLKDQLDKIISTNTSTKSGGSNHGSFTDLQRGLSMNHQPLTPSLRRESVSTQGIFAHVQRNLSSSSQSSPAGVLIQIL